ncbi:MAG: LysM peptidoglycan-binding domain-containing protein [Lentisphaerae bacterium]|nr:LysM peptidoglycan-binding domain-containing protein [Lentisphaerota bacterium]
MSWNRGTYGLETASDGGSPPLWPRLCAVVVLAVVIVFGVRACRSMDAGPAGLRRALAQPGRGAPPGPAAGPETAATPSQVLRIDRLPPGQRNLLAQAEEGMKRGDDPAARDAYLALLNEVADGPARREIEERLGALSITVAVSRLPMTGKVSYVIQKGDSTSSIARRFGVTQEYILRANGLSDPNRIVVGRELRVLDNPAFAITVSKKEKTLTVTLGSQFFKRYRVSVGRAGETPEGTFLIGNRVVHPAWWRTDGSEIPYGHPDNILGTRWLSLTAAGSTPRVKGYGIHGTWDDGAVGVSPSAGCIRMRNADVEELHLLAPSGTPVVIAP